MNATPRPFHLDALEADLRDALAVLAAALEPLDDLGEAHAAGVSREERLAIVRAAMIETPGLALLVGAIAQVVDEDRGQRATTAGATTAADRTLPLFE
jgi:hypothetical protein